MVSIISADSHVMEPPDLWWNALGDKLGERTPRIINEYLGQKGSFFDSGAQVISLQHREEFTLSQVPDRMRDVGHIPEARVAYQDEEGVEAEVLNPTNALHVMRGKDREVARACAEVYNDWLVEFCSYRPERFVGTSLVIIDDVEWGIGELKRATENGLNGAMINLDALEGAPPYRDRVYDRFWAVAEEMVAPITLHVVTGRSPSPVHFFSAEEQEVAPRGLIAIYTEIMGVLINEFIYGGILDRFPKLRLLQSEFEISWIPWFMHRVDVPLEQVAGRHNLPKLEMVPSEYMRTRISHGFIDDPYAMDVLPHIGVDQVLWGTDFPHEEGIGIGAQEFAAANITGLSDEDQYKLIRGNAERLWDL